MKPRRRGVPTFTPVRASNCWEVRRCGREPGGDLVGEKGACPVPTAAYADGINGGKNGGRICWAIGGSKCEGKEKGAFADPMHGCLRCPFLLQVREEVGWRKFVLTLPATEG